MARKGWLLAEIKSIRLDIKLITERKRKSTKLFPGFPAVRFKRTVGLQEQVEAYLDYKAMNSVVGTLSLKSQQAILIKISWWQHPESSPGPKFGRKAQG